MDVQSHTILRYTFIIMLCIAAAASAAKVSAIEEIHPVLLYTAQNIDEIKGRLDEPPYDEWYQRLITEADRILSLEVNWTAKAVPKATQAYYAKMLAAAYAFSDNTAPNREAYLEEATMSLYCAPDNDFKDEFNPGTNLEISEAGMHYGQAYDMLKGTGYDFVLNSVDYDPAIRHNLDNLRDYISTDFLDYTEQESIQRDFWSCIWNDSNIDRTNNHHVKLYGGLAVLSLAIYGEGGSAGDFNRARERLLQVLDNVTVTGDDGSPAGGWAEGPRYFSYSARQYIPALIAMKNADIFDYTSLDELTATHRHLPSMLMPDGYLPPVDENEAYRFEYAGLLSSLYPDMPDREVFDWMWDKGGRIVPVALLPDFLALYNPGPETPDSPDMFGWETTGFLPESGYARFRSSWYDDALYMLMLSEHGEARSRGNAHENPDPNSIILHAYGEMLILDSGYGGWDERNQTRYARNHNLILVDGNGPEAASKDGLFDYWSANGADAYLGDTYHGETTDYAVSDTRYEGAEFSRHVLFPNKRYFAIFDEIAAPDPHTYTLLWHGNGGGDSGGTYTPTENGAVWAQDNASVSVYTTGTGQLVFGTNEMPHAVYQRSPMQSHSMLTAEESGSDAYFLSLLIPAQTGEEAPAVNQFSTDDVRGFTINDDLRTEWTAINMNTGLYSVPGTAGDMSSDAAFLYISEENGDLVQAHMTHGTIFTSSKGGSIELTRPATMNVTYSTDGKAEGLILTDETLTFGMEASQFATVLWNDETVSTDWNNGMIRFSVDGSGEFTVYTQPPEPPQNLTVEDVYPDQGYRLLLKWLPSVSEDDDRVAWYRIYRSRSDSPTELRPQSNFTSIEDLVGFEEYGRVLVDSVGTGINEYTDTVPENGVLYYYWVDAAGYGGASAKASPGIVTTVEESPLAFTVNPPYPNPLNAATTITYDLPAAGHVVIDVLSITGQHVKQLLNSTQFPGFHSLIWDAGDFPSGIYFIRIMALNGTKTVSVSLIK